MTYRNITEIKKANKAAGHCWFSPATIKTFSSRVETPIMGGRYWVESTRNADDTSREYKLVMACDSGDVQYVMLPGTYTMMKYATRVEAIDALVDFIADREMAVNQ